MLTIADLAFSPARPVDLVDVRALLERCRLPTEDLEHAHVEHFVVCRADEELVGVVGLEVLGKMALLRSLAVAPDHSLYLGIGSSCNVCDDAPPLATIQHIVGRTILSYSLGPRNAGRLAFDHPRRPCAAGTQPPPGRGVLNGHQRLKLLDGNRRRGVLDTERLSALSAEQPPPRGFDALPGMGEVVVPRLHRHSAALEVLAVRHRARAGDLRDRQHSETAASSRVTWGSHPRVDRHGSQGRSGRV